MFICWATLLCLANLTKNSFKVIKLEICIYNHYVIGSSGETSGGYKGDMFGYFLVQTDIYSSASINK